MKILVSIATYGSKNFQYLNAIIDEYKSYKKYDVTINVHGTVPMDRNDINLTIHDNPKNTVFFHRQEFINEKDNYDLFLFSEDDLFVKEECVDMFVKYSEILPVDHCLGFLRYEKRSVDDPNDENLYLIDIWPHTGHISSNPCIVNGNHYFTLRNPHQGGWLLTKDSLNYVISKMKFLVNGNPGLETGGSGIFTSWPYGEEQGVIKKVHTKNKEDLKKCVVQHMSNRHVNGPRGLEYCSSSSNLNSLIDDLHL